MATPSAWDLQGSTVSLDGGYDCWANRKAIFNRGMVPNIPESPRGRKTVHYAFKTLTYIMIVPAPLLLSVIAGHAVHRWRSAP